MSSTCFEPEGSSSGRRLYAQEIKICLHATVKAVFLQEEEEEGDEGEGEVVVVVVAGGSSNAVRARACARVCVSNCQG